MRSNPWNYQSYLLRLWRESIDGEWRASLQNIATGRCVYFSTLPQLCAFLEEGAIQPQQVGVEEGSEYSEP